MLLYALLVWLPLPLGSNRPLFWTINAAAAGIIALAIAIGELRLRRSPAIDWRAPAAAALLFCVVVGWTMVQALPGLPAVLHHPAWTLTGSAGADRGTISINPSATWTAILQLAPVGLVAFAGFSVGLNPKRALFPLRVVVATALALAIYGLVARYFDFRSLWILDEDAYPGFLTATFVNRNTAAAYLVLGLAATTSLIVHQNAAERSPDSAANPFMRLAEALRRAGGLMVVDLVLLVALLNSGSRGGTMAGFAALAVIGFLSVVQSGFHRRAVLTTASVLVLLLAVGVVAMDPLLGRLQSGVGSEDRLSAYADTIDMIAARPLLGQGLGTFADAYPLFHVRASDGAAWTHAHNAFLEGASGLGIPVFLTLLGAIGILGFVQVMAVVARRRPQPAAVASLACLVALALHSLVDFSVQIQAIALTAAAICGAGVGESLRASLSRGPERQTGSAGMVREAGQSFAL